LKPFYCFIFNITIVITIVKLFFGFNQTFLKVLNKNNNLQAKKSINIFAVAENPVKS